MKSRVKFLEITLNLFKTEFKEIILDYFYRLHNFIIKIKIMTKGKNIIQKEIVLVLEGLVASNLEIIKK